MKNKWMTLGNKQIYRKSEFRKLVLLGLLGLSFMLSSCQQEKLPEQSASFNLMLSQTSFAVTQGATETLELELKLERKNLTDEINFSLKGDAATGSFSPAKTTADSTILSLNLKSDLAVGEYALTIKAVGANLEKTAEITLNVKEASSPEQPSQQGAEAYAPGKQGVLKTVTINGQTVTYEEIDGLAIYQGDMILGKVADIEALRQGDFSTLGVSCDGSTWVFFFTRCNRWDGGVVRFSIANDWSSSENNTIMQARIRRAISHWREKTNLRFVETSSGDRIVFQNSGGCSSQVGRIGSDFTDTQDINLSMGCGDGAVIHEIGHAIGIFHEQSRQDRDSFVRINTANIQDDRGNNFDRHVDDARDIGSYDFASIMHYGCTAFSRNGEPTITPVDPSITCDMVGQRAGLSDGDIYTAYTLYPVDFTIEGVAAGSSLPRNNAIDLRLEFAGEAVNPDYIVWTSDRVASYHGTGLSSRIWAPDWPTGEHVITANIIIGGQHLVGRTIRFTLTNVNPVVEILEPSSETGLSFCQGEAIRFRASASDFDTPPSRTLPDSAFSWRVGSSAAFATGSSVSRTFAVGTYTVTVRASDTDGGSSEASVSINVGPCTDTAPTVRITSPAADTSSSDSAFAYDGFDDAKGMWYKDVSLTGIASDAEDGALTGSSLVWTTNQTTLQVARLGTGPNLTARLYSNTCAGVWHEITLSVTDSDGNTRTAIRRIFIWTLC